MGVIDTSQWKEFRIGDLFEIHPTKAYSKTNSDLFFEEGNVPVVVNSSQNNGIGGFAPFDSLEKGHIITFSDTTDANSIFYQPMPFIGYPHVQGMYPKFANVSDAVMLFIKTAFQKQATLMNFDYANKFRRDIAANIVIKLPSTSAGAPDWDYMDSFMGKILEKEESAAEQLAALAPEDKKNGHFLDVSGWKTFRIGDLFEIHPTKAYKLTNSNLLDSSGSIPVVANSAQNNGIVGFSNLAATEKGGIITFSDTTDANSIFYQAHDFIGYAHVQGMYRKFEKVSDAVMLFLATAFQSQALKMSFDYTNKFRRDIASNIEISLPVTPNGTPDWVWMEQYMQQQLDKTEKLAEHLNELN